MSKKLEVVLRKMKVGELKKEISKQNIRGYSKMRKEEIINLMLDNKKRFKYLLLDNLKQKKELLEDKVKLKKAKEKLEKLTAKKIPAKKAQKAEVIKPKPKREPMIPKIIEPKPITIKKGGKFVTVKKELKDIDLLELKLKNLENDFSNTKSPGSAKNGAEAQKRVEIRDKLMSQIRKVKAQIFDAKQKDKIKLEKDKIKKEKDELKEFRKKIEEFIGNPNDELLEEIDQKFELLDELPQFLQDNFDDAMEKYEFANSKEGKKFKEEVEKLDKKVKSDVDKKLKPKKEEPKKEDSKKEKMPKYLVKNLSLIPPISQKLEEIPLEILISYEDEKENIGFDAMVTDGGGRFLYQGQTQFSEDLSFQLQQFLICKVVKTLTQKINNWKEKKGRLPNLKEENIDLAYLDGKGENRKIKMIEFCKLKENIFLKKEEKKKEILEIEDFKSDLQKVYNEPIINDINSLYYDRKITKTKAKQYELNYRQKVNPYAELIMTFYTKGSGTLVNEYFQDSFADDERLEHILVCHLVETFIKELNEKSEKNNYNIDKIKYYGSTLGEYCKISNEKELRGFRNRGIDENEKLQQMDKYSYLV